MLAPWMNFFRRRPPLPELPLHFKQIEQYQHAIWRQVQAYTMTSQARVHGLCQAIAHLHHHEVPGDVVECGVWRGGSMMAAALTLLHLGSTQRRLYLFDTFQGMTEPGELDIDHQGRPARVLLDGPDAEHIRACCSLTAVRGALSSTRYPLEKIICVPGAVEETLPAEAPDSIALLRLDTDWYQSTRHELEHLYSRVVVGGIVLIDDYGHWRGARKAVDEFFADLPAVDLIELDYTGRLFIKPASHQLAEFQAAGAAA